MKSSHRPRRLPRRASYRLTYANVMSTLAIFGVLAGGGAYAAQKIGAGDIKPDAVRSKHVKDGSLLRKDVKPGQLPTGARGYAHIGAEGWEPAASKGVTEAAHPSKANPFWQRIWCFDLSFAAENAVTTLEFGSAADEVQVEFENLTGGSFACPPGLSDAGAFTFPGAGTFFIAFN